MDPETGLDAVRDVAIKDGRIAAIGDRLPGARTIDAVDAVIEHPLAHGGE